MASVEALHWWWRARREIVACTLEQYAPKLSNRRLEVVEVGCGTGGNLPMLETFGRVLGAEHQPIAIDHLKKRHGDRFEVVRHAVPEALPRVFDILAMLDVLEHIEDDRSALDWVARQLVPNGVAVITVPAFQFLWSDLDEALHHFRRYQLADLRTLVPPTLEVVHLTYYNTLLFAPVAGVRFAQRFLPKHLRSGGEQLDLPSPVVNGLLYRLFRSERHVVPKLSFPVGVSALLVLRRSATAL
jgi:SAM-dependent methyltransferase